MTAADKLEGPALCHAVAVACGYIEGEDEGGRCWLDGGAFVAYLRDWRPDFDWDQCGPLIDRHLISTTYVAGCWAGETAYGPLVTGRTACEAACRAVVAAQLASPANLNALTRGTNS